jgi:voltage-gated potassium channel
MLWLPTFQAYFGAQRQERHSMWLELLVALLLMVSNVVIQALGTFALIQWGLRSLQHTRSLGVAGGLGNVIRFFIVLPILHFFEAAVWAEFYLIQHCFSDRETAYYFSLKSYTTVGYGDIVILPPWRLMGSLEAMTGVLLFGWSTAILVGFVSRFREVRERNQATAGG